MHWKLGLDRRELPITKNGNSLMFLSGNCLLSLYTRVMLTQSFLLLYVLYMAVLGDTRLQVAKSIVYPICKTPFPNHIAPQPRQPRVCITLKTWTFTISFVFFCCWHGALKVAIYFFYPSINMNHIKFAVNNFLMASTVFHVSCPKLESMQSSCWICTNK